MNSQSALSRAWSRSVERSPLLNLARWILNRGYPNAQARDLISAADLPKPLTILIDTTVTKTKLWQSERAEVARELISHTQDATEAGRSPKQIIESFGHPKKVAKLFRRATKRKRPLYWRTLRNIRRAVATLTLLIIITYGSLAARFYTGHPNITKNYAVMINSNNDAYTEDEKAWPVYQELILAWDLHIKETRDRQIAFARAHNEKAENGDEGITAGFSEYPDIPTGHHDYAETVQLFKAFEPQLKRLREATHRPIIGIELGFNQSSVIQSSRTHMDDSVLPSDNPEENPSLINLLLPHLGRVRQLANTLAFDTLIAARESDSNRTYENLSAILALARQKSFDRTLISSLVNMAIADVAFNLIHQVLIEHPGTLTREHLVALSHELFLTRPATEIMLEGEIMMFNDLFQRAYTDDGHGNGRITKEGMLMFASYAGESWTGSDLDGTPLQMAAGPITLAVSPSRKSQATLYKEMMDTVKSIARTSPQHISLLNTHRQYLQTKVHNIPGIRYSPIEILMPAMGHSLSSSFIAQMNLDAIATILAIEIYKTDHGQLPDSLSQLTPNYLPSIPQDLFNPGQPLNYKQTDTGYLIYSVGDDGDDDNAQVNKDRHRDDHFFTHRFPGAINAKGHILLNGDGSPQLAPPTGQDGDWILFNMTPTPQSKEPLS